jgi:hypothetical protein
MSYQTGAASSSTDLIQKLATWLVSLGWTQDRNAAEGGGWTTTLHNNGNYVHCRACENESTGIWQNYFAGAAAYGVAMYSGTAYDGSQPFNNQVTGAPIAQGGTNPIGVGMHLSVGPFSNYYFFADATADNIVVVVEKTPGLFVHMGWGLSLVKAGAYTGGAYIFGSTSGYYFGYTFAGANVPGFTSSSDCPGVNTDQIGAACCLVRADVDSFTGKWIGIWATTSGGSQGWTGKVGDTSVRGTGVGMRTNFPVYASSLVPYNFQYEQVSAQDGRANLLPIYLWALRDGTTTGFSLLGAIPNVHCTNAVGHGFSNADEYVLGAKTYKLFPNFSVVKQ